MFTVLWAYLRNSAFKKDGVDYHVSADLTGQANHLAATVEADIVKQKQPQNTAVQDVYLDDTVSVARASMRAKVPGNAGPSPLPVHGHAGECEGIPADRAEA